MRIPEHDDRDRAASQILLVAYVLVRGDQHVKSGGFGGSEQVAILALPGMLSTAGHWDQSSRAIFQFLPNFSVKDLASIVTPAWRDFFASGFQARGLASQLCIARPIHLPHSAFAQLFQDAIRTESLAYHRRVLRCASARPRRSSRTAPGPRTEAGPPSPICAVTS